MPPPSPIHKTLYLGRFIHTPTPDELAIHGTGAVLVGTDGVIEKVAWGDEAADALVLSQVKAEGGKGGGNQEGEGGDGREKVEVVRCEEEGFWFPGFVDTHIHAPQYPNVGLFGSSTLLSWLETYTFPLESSFGSPNTPFQLLPGAAHDSKPLDPLTHARTIYNRVVSRTLKHGTTTAAYYATIHVPATNLLADIAHARGQRAFIGRVCMDEPRTCPAFYCDACTEDTVAKTREVIAHCRALDPEQSGLITPILTPRFGPSCLRRTFAALGDLAREEQLPIQTHIAENAAECALVESMFPDLASPSHSSSGGYAGLFDAFALLTPRTILAHAIHLSPAEISLIAARGANVSHCPASNTAIGSGFCSVRRLRDAGVTVGLGTDVSGGWSVGMLESVRQAVLVGRCVGIQREEEKRRRQQEGRGGMGRMRMGGDGEGGAEEDEDEDEEEDVSRYHVGVTEALYLATRGGATVCGFDGEGEGKREGKGKGAVRLGGFEPGMSWDVQEISLAGDTGSKVDVWPWERWEERVEKWVWNGDDRNVRGVWVGGRRVV